MSSLAFVVPAWMTTRLEPAAVVHLPSVDRTFNECSISIMKLPSKHAAKVQKLKASRARSDPVSSAASMTAEHYIDAARSTATKRAYAADLAHFLASGGELPATPQQLSAYLAKLAATLAVATIERRLIGIHRAHQDRNLMSPAVHVSVRQTMQGIRRTLGTAQRRVRAIVKDELLGLLALTDQQKPIKAARDRALLLLGFAGAFRRSELVSLRSEDVIMNASGMDILIRRSKTDQQGAGRMIFIPFSQGAYCPVQALFQWQCLSGIKTGYLFRAVSRYDRIAENPLTPQSVALIVKSAMKRSGHDHTGVSAHSLRAGYVTTAAEMGLQSYQIREQTGHRSDTMLARYIRPIQQRKIPSLL